MLRPGGTLIYCTCSLESEEGARRITALLESEAPVARRPIDPGEIGAPAAWITGAGDLRTLPCYFEEYDGLDGFFCARLVKHG